MSETLTFTARAMLWAGCEESTLARLMARLGGGLDTPHRVEVLLLSGEFELALWVLRAASPRPEAARMSRLLAADFVDSAMPPPLEAELRLAVSVARENEGTPDTRRLAVARKLAWNAALARRPYGNGHRDANVALAAVAACSTLATLAGSNAAYLTTLDMVEADRDRERHRQALAMMQRLQAQRL